LNLRISILGLLSASRITHQCFGQLLQAFPFLYFLQHFFFLDFACITGKGKGSRNAVGFSRFSEGICFAMLKIFHKVRINLNKDSNRG
jgi:hypothetical protein